MINAFGGRSAFKASHSLYVCLNILLFFCFALFLVCDNKMFVNVSF